MNERKMSVDGRFYPDTSAEINRFIEHFNGLLAQEHKHYRPRAVIVPHAGYVYSGFTANAAYHLLDASAYKRVIVIGPSHRVYLKGASIALQERYATPYGALKMDQVYAQGLMRSYEFLAFNPQAHYEHSTETQMPFIAHYLPDIPVIEVVYGELSFDLLSPMIEALLEERDNLIVISTDLSHFHTLKEANLLDGICLQAIEKMQLNALDQGCEACGKIGVKALMQAAINQGLKARLVDYRTSYDASEDASSVVGYMSALVGEEENLPPVD